jgi:hypothetical protein
MDASEAVDSGQISLSLDLALDGIKQLGGKPVALSVSGPFERSDGKLSADLTATLSAASATADIGIDKVGSTIYLELAGTYYELPAGALKTIEGHATGASGATRARSGLRIDPQSWLTDPRDLGQARVGGVTTDHVQAQIDVANVLGEVSALIAGAGAKGTSANSSATSLLPLLESAITSAQVDIYTGIADHIVRKFHLAIGFTVPQIAAGAIDGLTGGSLTLDGTLTDLNQPQTISPPADAQPSSKLLNGVFALESKFGSLASLVSGLTGGSGAGGLLTPAAASSSSSSTASSG